MVRKKERKDPAKELGVRAAKGTAIYTVGNITGSLIVLLLLAILARLLSPAEFGLYAIAIAFYNLLSAHFVFGTAMRKELPRSKDDKERQSGIISNGYYIAMPIAVAVAVAAVLLSGYVATGIYHNRAMAGQLEIASAMVVLYALFNMTLATLIAVGKTKKGTVLYLMYAIIQLIASVALVMLGYGVSGAIAGMGIGLIVPSAIGMLWVAQHIDWKFTNPSGSVMKGLAGFSAPVLASNVAQFAPTNLAILLLGVYASPLIVGNYNAAFRFGNFVSVVLASVSFVLLPIFSTAFSERSLSAKIGRIYNSSIYYTLLMLLPLLVYVVSVAHPLMFLLFSKEYALAPLYFIVIALGSALGIIGIYASNLQVGFGNTKLFMYYQLLAVAIQVALLFALTPLLGVDGVLLALFVISQVLIDIIYVYALYRQFRFRHEFARIARLIAPAAILVALLYPITLLLHNGDAALAVNLVLVVLLFPPLAALFKGVTGKELSFIRAATEGYGAGFIAKYILDYTQMFIR